MDTVEKHCENCRIIYKKIADIILQAIPFEKWKRVEKYSNGYTVYGNYECKFGNILISLQEHTTNSSSGFILSIDGKYPPIIIYNDRISELEDKLNEVENIKRREDEIVKLNELLDLVSSAKNNVA